MKINYKFADGTTSEVEVDEELGAFITASRREEANYNRKTRYHCVSLDFFDFEGEAFKDKHSSPDEVSADELSQQRVEEFLNTLTDIQRRRLEMRLDGLSFAEIARREGTYRSAIHACFEDIRKRAEKFF